MNARSLVAALLDSEEADTDFSMDYIDRAGEKWVQINLITSREWRAMFQSLGYRVKSFYRHKSSDKRRYAYFNLSVVPKDGHLVDEADAALLTEYMYELLEKRFGKKRWEGDALIDARAWSAGTWTSQHTTSTEDWVEWMRGRNQIDITVQPPGDGSRYDSFQPLAGWGPIRR